MARSISKDTQLCISLSGRPSNIGTRFHNHLYAELGLDFVYKAGTTDDLPAAIAGVRALGIRGCGVSMPFKEACIPLLDDLDESARTIESVNTIVNDGGVLLGSNTDYLAMVQILSVLPPGDRSFALVGSGGMARSVAAALSAAGFTDGVVIARNEGRGRALAARHGLAWRSDLGARRPAMILNATPIGMAGGVDTDALPVPAAAIAGADVVVDVVAMPVETPLIRLARSQGKLVVTGAEVSMRQAAEQFLRYTGVLPTDDQIQRATAYAHAAV